MCFEKETITETNSIVCSIHFAFTIHNNSASERDGDTRILTWRPFDRMLSSFALLCVKVCDNLPKTRQQNWALLKFVSFVRVLDGYPICERLLTKRLQFPCHSVTNRLWWLAFFIVRPMKWWCDVWCSDFSQSQIYTSTQIVPSFVLCKWFLSSFIVLSSIVFGFVFGIASIRIQFLSHKYGFLLHQSYQQCYFCC